MNLSMNNVGLADAPSAEEATRFHGVLAKLQLDPLTSEPFYQQLKRQIHNLIDSGELAAGSNLPSERMLAEALNVSRTTIKRCYNDLREAQVLSTHGRGGTQIQAKPNAGVSANRLKGFAEDMRERGMVPSSQLLSQEVVQDRMIASIFDCPSVNTFLRLVRVRLGDGIPLAREVAWYDLTLAPHMGLGLHILARQMPA